MQHKNEKVEDKLVRVFNSSIGFAIAYLLINIGYQLTIGFIAKVFNVGRHFYPFGIDVTQNLQYWNREIVIFVYISGFLFCLLASILGYILYNKYSRKEIVFNLFFLWLNVIGLLMALGHFIVGVLANNDHTSFYYNGFAVIYAWLYLPKIVTVSLMAVGIIAMAILVYFSAKKFISFTYSFSKINKSKRRQLYYLSIALFPALFGSIISLIAIQASYLFSHNQSYLHDNYDFLYINITYLIIIFIAMLLGLLFIVKMETNPDDLVRFKNIQHISFPMFLLLLAVFAIYIFSANGINLH